MYLAHHELESVSIIVSMLVPSVKGSVPEMECVVGLN